jgi:hypothetical protein
MSDKASTIESREHDDLVVFLSDRSHTSRPSQNYKKEYPSAEVQQAEYPLNLLELKKLAKEAETRAVAVVAIATARLTELHIQKLEEDLKGFAIPLILVQQEEKGTPGQAQTRL